MKRHYGLAMVSFTPVIVLAAQLASPADTYALISERARRSNFPVGNRLSTERRALDLQPAVQRTPAAVGHQFYDPDLTARTGQVLIAAAVAKEFGADASGHLGNRWPFLDMNHIKGRSRLPNSTGWADGR